MEDRMTVSDLMTTALITMKPKDTVASADVDMRLAAIRHIPVVDDRGKLVGILSNRDILRAVGGGSNATIGDIMTKSVHTVTEDTPAAEAAEIMLEHKIGALPVVGDGNQLVGLVTESDFVAVARDLLND